MNCCFCSSVPHCRMVGPTSVSPKKSARSGASARANSSLSTTDSIRDRPLPPYSFGHDAQIQPPSKSFFVHSSLNWTRSSAVQLEARLEPAVGQVAPRARSRISMRNCSASGG